MSDEKEEKAKVCPRCKGRKVLPKFDEYDGKLCGSFKCPDCNNGAEPLEWWKF